MQRTFFTTFLIVSTAAASLAQTSNPVTFATGQSARLVIGQPEFDAESDGASQTIIGAVGGLAYANGTLFVADSNMVGAAPVNNRVLLYGNISAQLPAPNEVLPYNTLCPVCVGSATLVLGQADFVSVLPAPCVPPPITVTTTTTPTTPACTTASPQTPIANGMRVPTAVASDGTHVAVADTLNNRILIWNSIPTTMNQPPDVVVGQSTFTTAAFPGDTPNANSLRGPQGVWIQNGKLYVADTQNNRVLIYNSIPTSNGAAADIVLGQPNMTTWVQVNIANQTTSAAANNMLTPVSVSSDGTHLFVTDLGYHRVLIWNELPTSNQQAADVEIGQTNITTGIPDDAYNCVQNGVVVGTASGGCFSNIVSDTTASTVITEVAVMCTTSNGIDVNSNPIYPTLCASTLSFPSYAFADSTGRLYIADGGNDRVLIFNSIPTSDGASADLVLGQTDFVSDAPTDGADTMDAPLSLAFDGSNLYVADSYNQRILVYTVSEQDLPYNGVTNAASQTIYAYGTVAFAGTIKSGDTVTITIGNSNSATTKAYAYTITSGDTFADIVTAFVELINAGSSGDPNALATPDPKADQLVLTAKAAGPLGNDVTLATSVSANAEISATASGTNLSGGASTASIAPGTLVTFLGTNLSDQTASAPATAPLPLDLGGVEVYFNGVQSPLIYVSPTQINAQVPFNFGFANTTTANAWVRIQRNDGSVVATDSVAISIVPANPGIFAQPCATQPCALPLAQAYHASSYATAVISVDGTAKAGNIASVCLGDSSSELTATATIPTGCTGRLYNYELQSSDSLQDVQHALVALINQDPQFSATNSSEFTRVLLQARTPGTAGNGIPFQVAYSTGANVLITGIGPSAPSGSYGFVLCCANTAGSLVTTNNPALPGETIVVYATGLGVPYLTPLISQDLLSGQPYQGPAGNHPQNFVSALINNTTANVLRSELAPGMIGIYQVYLQLGTGLTTDPAAQLTIAQNTFVSNHVGVPVYATPQLSSIACTPSTLTPGTVTTCTVTLTVAVPTGATTINLTSSDTTNLSVPSSITIAAGTTENTFTATAGTVSVSETVTLTATLGTVSSITTLTLNP
ncbi:MAG: hypothetical protein ABSH50_17950 [Bryobacteraceae bacterium]|jgi:uncharacterized protein (TIGR03437 family)